MNEEALKIARISAKYNAPVSGWVVVELLAGLDRRGAVIERVREAAEKIERAESLGAARALGARIGDVLAALDGGES